MRRTGLPLLIAVGLISAGALTGCAQVAQTAGDALGVDVQAACTSIDEAYAQYQALLDQGGATADQVDAARDELVATLEGLSGDAGGPLGDLASSAAEQIGGMSDLQSPETVEAIEDLHGSLSAFCG